MRSEVLVALQRGVDRARSGQAAPSPALKVNAPQESPEAWGPKRWAELHAFCLTEDARDPAKLAAFVAAWRKTIPRLGCACRAKTDAYLEAHPPDASDPFGWSVGFHNAINEDLGKAGLGVEEARTIHLAGGVGGDRRGIEPASTGN